MPARAHGQTHACIRTSMFPVIVLAYKGLETRALFRLDVLPANPSYFDTTYLWLVIPT
jgi:hypothetical protein